MNIKNLFGQQTLQPPAQPSIPQPPRQPWIPTGEEMMRLNALQLAVQIEKSDFVPQPHETIERASEFYKYLAGEHDVKGDGLADRKWWQF